MGRSDLLEIMDAIPNLEDEEALKSVFETFTGYADKQVKRREQELLSGVTPPVCEHANNRSSTGFERRMAKIYQQQTAWFG